MNWQNVLGAVAVLSLALNIALMVRSFFSDGRKEAERKIRMEERDKALEVLIKDSCKALENQVNFALKQISEANKKADAIGGKLDKARTGLDVLKAIVEERTGKIAIASDVFGGGESNGQ